MLPWIPSLAPLSFGLASSYRNVSPRTFIRYAQVGYKSVDDHVESGMVVGLGTGSTAYFAVERLGEKLKSGELKDIIAIPTSERTREQAESLGIPLCTLNEKSVLDVAIDGADEDAAGEEGVHERDADVPADPVKVVDLTEGEHVERELMLVKLRAVGAQRAEIKRTADIFRGQIVDATESAYTVQLVGVSSKLDAFLRAVGELSILEVVRSGVSGLARGEKVVSV